MANDFQALAQDLIKTTFAQYVKDLTLVDGSNYDPITEAETATQYAVKGIRLSLDYSKYQGQAVQIGDFGVIFPAEDLSIEPAAGMRCTFDGKSCQVISAEKDPADAAWLIIVRAR